MLSYNHPSGLISDYCSSYSVPYAYYASFSGSINCCPNNGRPSTAQRETKVRTTEYAKKINMLREKDGMQIIHSYLKSNSIDDFQIDRLFKVENKTVSVNFVFRDKNIIIKYWNPDETRSLSQESGYKKTYYENYLKQWNELCQAHEEKGGKIYQIESADKEEILSKLSLCRELSEG